MCIFCKIIDNEIPSYVVYENDSFKAILDINPTTMGHTLVIPKSHSDNFSETSDEVLGKLLLFSKEVVTKLQVLGFDNYNLLINNGRLAGQTMMHLHLHIIPIYKLADNVVTFKECDCNPEDVLKRIIQK